ncbi:MAG: methyltransferase domain-containing protein, partial [Magnetococcales bacterium]|nr:methyltransferase domain-containing protein [Magnetococcales bacterium]
MIEEIGGSLDSQTLADGIRRLALTRSESLNPQQALQFLFQLDAHLYPLQGRNAIRYDQGVHSKKRHTGYHQFFIKRIRSGERVLDVGCGSGMLALDLAKQTGERVLGIDLNPKNIELANKRERPDNLSYQVGDILHYVTQEPFDVVILSNVLEHLDGRVHFLRQLIEVTQCNRFLFRVP